MVLGVSGAWIRALALTGSGSSPLALALALGRVAMTLAVPAILRWLVRVAAALSLSLRGPGSIVLTGARVGSRPLTLAGSGRWTAEILGTRWRFSLAARIPGRSGRAGGPGRRSVLGRWAAGLGGGGKGES